MVRLRTLRLWVAIAVIVSTVSGFFWGRSENRVIYAATFDAVQDMLNDAATARHLEMHTDSIVVDAQESLGR